MQLQSSKMCNSSVPSLQPLETKHSYASHLSWLLGTGGQKNCLRFLLYKGISPLDCCPKKPQSKHLNPLDSCGNWDLLAHLYIHFFWRQYKHWLKLQALGQSPFVVRLTQPKAWLIFINYEKAYSSLSCLMKALWRAAISVKSLCRCQRTRI